MISAVQSQCTWKSTFAGNRGCVALCVPVAFISKDRGSVPWASRAFATNSPVLPFLKRPPAFHPAAGSVTETCLLPWCHSPPGTGHSTQAPQVRQKLPRSDTHHEQVMAYGWWGHVPPLRGADLLRSRQLRP